MAKNGIYSEVEKLATRIANDIVKNHPLIASMAHWHSVFTAENKNIRDANRILELRIVQLEKDLEQLKKIQMAAPENMLLPALEETVEPEIPQEPAMTARELKKIRGRYNFNQQKMAELLGVSSHRYNKWERGEIEIPADVADNLRAFTEMPLGELREFLHSKGIFQPNGTVARQQKVTKAQTIINSVQQSRYTAEDLKNIRTAANLSLSKIAEYLGVPSSTYSSWEYNRAHMPDKYTQQIIALQEKSPAVAQSAAPTQGRAIIRNNGRPTPSPYKSKDLLAVRTKLNYTQQQMAAEFGVPKNTYATWERGGCNMPDKYTDKFIVLAEEEKSHASVPEKITITKDDLKKLRLKSGKDQRGFARVIGVSHSQYAKWEQGTRGISPHFAEIILRKFPELSGADATVVQEHPRSEGVVYASDLEELRIRLQMTYKDFSQRLGISDNSFWIWRKNNKLIEKQYLPRVKRLYALARGMPQPGSSSEPDVAPTADVIKMQDVEDARIRLNLTIKAIAELLKISDTTYKLWRNGNIDVPERAIALAKKVMGMTVPATNVFGSRTRKKRETEVQHPFAPASTVTAENLKQLRNRMKLTQVKMAVKFGVSPSAYQKWEQGVINMPGAYTAAYKKLLSGLSAEIDMPEIPVLTPDAPPIPKAANGHLDVTPEMLLILNSARQQFGLPEEKMCVLLEMDVTTYRQLESGEKNTIKIAQWEKLEFLLNMDEERREKSIQTMTNTGKENNE